MICTQIVAQPLNPWPVEMTNAIAGMIRPAIILNHVASLGSIGCNRCAARQVEFIEQSDNTGKRRYGK